MSGRLQSRAEQGARRSAGRKRVRMIQTQPIRAILWPFTTTLTRLTSPLAQISQLKGVFSPKNFLRMCSLRSLVFVKRFRMKNAQLMQGASALVCCRVRVMYHPSLLSLLLYGLRSPCASAQPCSHMTRVGTPNVAFTDSAIKTPTQTSRT